MRTRLFLRTAEFLWQEGHTAHETKAEAIAEAIQMNEVYAEFAENFMAIPVIKGIKTESERFAGALETYCIEALMQDGKALQAGTSHFLGQNFAKAFDVKFNTKEGQLDYVWATSWGVSTRLMGALIMTHSDDKGLVLPPNLAPIQVVIVPIYKTDEQLEEISILAKKLIQEFKGVGISCKYDDRDTQRPGAKFAQYELQGVPLRIAIGPKDLENKTVELARRDTLTKENVALDDLVSIVKNLMTEIQNALFKKALDFRNTHITEVHTFDEFKHILENKTGFVSAHWGGTPETEQTIKELTKATIRCIPIDAINEAGTCVYSGQPSTKRVLFAKAY
jgi:prolyl-tRNA synthetase